MEFYEMRRGFLSKINYFKNLYFFFNNSGVRQDIPVCTPVSFSQWTQSNACRLKTVGGVGFEVTGNVTFQESRLYNMNYSKINNYTSSGNQ